MFSSGGSEFCSICGSILPLPEPTRLTVACGKCKTSWKTPDLTGKVLWRTELKFQKIADVDPNAGSADGPTVDRLCAKCGHEKMTYSTRQTRSADEGQTVFFTCAKCGYKDIEYS